MRTSIHVKDAHRRQPSQVWPSPMPSSVFLTHGPKIGAQFHTIHGRTNAILLPYVIRYNGTRPAKTATWPKYILLPCRWKIPRYRSYARTSMLYSRRSRWSLRKSCIRTRWTQRYRNELQSTRNAKKRMEEKHSRESPSLLTKINVHQANPRLPMVRPYARNHRRCYYGYKERPGK